jgi:hypothetical protein
MAAFTVSSTVQKILKNFATISSQVLLAEGKTQKTIAQGKSVLAIAELPDAWPQETGIYDLDKFLGILSLDSKPEIEFGEEAMTITSGASSVNYRYSDPTTILVPPNKTLPTDKPAVEFTLSEAAFSRLGKVVSMLDLDLVVFSVSVNGDEKSVSVAAKDSKNPVSHTAKIVVPSEDIVAHQDFTADLSFKSEHFRLLMDGAYTVHLAKWPYGFFTHKTEPVSYFIVAQP